MRRALQILTAILLALSYLTHSAEAGSYTTRTTLLKNRDFAEALIDGISSSKKSVHFSFFLFKVTDTRNNIPRRIADELVRARKRGVEVTVLLERPLGSRSSSGVDSLYSDNRKTADILAKGGVKVYFDSPSIKTHTKVAVIDSHLVFIGSHNLSQSALKHNNELSVMIESPELAAEVNAYIEKL